MPRDVIPPEERSILVFFLVKFYFFDQTFSVSGIQQFGTRAKPLSDPCKDMPWLIQGESPWLEYWNYVDGWIHKNILEVITFLLWKWLLRIMLCPILSLLNRGGKNQWISTDIGISRVKSECCAPKTPQKIWYIGVIDQRIYFKIPPENRICYKTAPMSKSWKSLRGGIILMPVILWWSFPQRRIVEYSVWQPSIVRRGNLERPDQPRWNP